MSVINDKLGFEKKTNIFTDVSYRIDLDSYDEYKITFGMKVGARKYGISDELLNDPDYNNDPYLNTLDTSWKPNIGMGIYFRGESFYLGLSTPKLINNTNNNEFASIERMSYFFNGGYVWEVNKNLIFKPTFLFKVEEGAPMSFDLSTMFFVNEFVWLGVSYRFTESLGALVNFKIYEGLSFGYSYEYITADLNPYTTGSHEFMLNYEFNFPKPRCKCKHLYN
jgi:type IX secretion system PorP/SprF family membrane protein